MKRALIATLLVIWLCATQAAAQFYVENLDKHPALKAKGLNVVMNDTVSEVNKAYWNIYKTCWTYSKVNFVPYADLDNYLHDTAYFITIIRYKSSQVNKHSIYWEADYGCSLTLWEYKAKGKQGKLLKEDILNGDMNRHINYLAGIGLFSSESKACYKGNYRDNGEPDIPKLSFYTGGGYDGFVTGDKNMFFNWSPGLLKNYLQGFCWYASQHKVVGMGIRDLYEKEKMEALKRDTLFIPDFAFAEYAMNEKVADVPLLVEKKETSKEKSLRLKKNANLVFAKYKYPHKIISTEDLNRRLLENKKPFNYLIYSTCCTDKIVLIMNSENGENIYFTWSTKGNYEGNILTGHLAEIRLEPKDIQYLVDKMNAK